MSAFRTEVGIYAETQRVPEVLGALLLPFVIAPYRLPYWDTPSTEDISLLTFTREWTDEHKRAAIRQGKAGVIREVVTQTRPASEG